jgi:oligoendopeptidase F
MGLLNGRNLRMAKQLLEKNRHKVGDAVEKAGTQLDKVSKGKTSNVTSKASDAAKKYSAGGASDHGIDTTPRGSNDNQADPTMSRSDAKVREAQAAAGAADAVKGAANAFTNFINTAASKAEAANQAKSGGAADAATADPNEIPRDKFD